MTATTATVKVEGVRELARSLRRVGEGYPKELRTIHRKVADPVARHAEILVPRRSGVLAGSIRAQGTQRVARVAAGRKSVPYAGVIHFGWPGHNIEPQPFLYDALAAKQVTVLDIYTRETDRFIDRVWETIT